MPTECRNCGEVEEHPYHVHGCNHHCDAAGCVRVPVVWSRDRIGLLEAYCPDHREWCTGATWSEDEMKLTFAPMNPVVKRAAEEAKRAFEEKYGWTG